MKKLLVLLILLCFYTTAYADGWFFSGGSALSCPADESIFVELAGQQDDFYSVASAETATYMGQGHYDPGANKTVCAVTFGIRVVAGATKTWQVEIWENSGDDLGNAPTGDCISDSQAISGAGEKKFLGMSCELSNGTDYCIVITRSDHGNSGSDYVQAWVDTNTSALDGAFSEWDSSKTRNNSFGADSAIDMYGF